MLRDQTHLFISVPRRKHFKGVEWSTKESKCKIFLFNLYFSSENDYCKWGSSWESSPCIMLDSGVERTLNLGLLNIKINLPKIKRLEEQGAEEPTKLVDNSGKMCKAWRKSPWAGRRCGHRMELTLSIFPIGPLWVSGQQPTEQQRGWDASEQSWWLDRQNKIMCTQTERKDDLWQSDDNKEMQTPRN